VPGFGCRVFPTGKRSFICQYRLPGSRKVTLVNVGTYGTLTLPQARTQARELLGKAKLGIDPQAGKRARQAEEAAQATMLTVAKLVAAYTEALRGGRITTARSSGPPSASHLADTLLHLGRFEAALGKRAAGEVTRADIARLLAARAGQPQAHRRMLGSISRMFAWAAGMGLVAANPAEHIPVARTKARERVLSLAELASVWKAAEALGPLYRDYLHLLIATGQRRTEVAAMTWGEVDLLRGLWTLPAARTKAGRQHAIPLAQAAVAVLQGRRGAAQKPPAPEDLVLPTLSVDGKRLVPISGWNFLKRRLDALVPLPDWQLHDFRRSLVTHCAERGADVATLDTLLNHASSVTRGGVIGVYQRATLLEPMRWVMALWGDVLANGEPVAGKVVPFRIGAGV
jgi:integrase